MANMLLRTELCASTHAKSSLTVEDAELDIKCIANNCEKNDMRVDDPLNVQYSIPCWLSLKMGELPSIRLATRFVHSTICLVSLDDRTVCIMAKHAVALPVLEAVKFVQRNLA